MKWEIFPEVHFVVSINVVTLLQVVFTIVTVLCIDRAGRRVFLLGGSTLMSIAIVTMGFVTLSWPSYQITDACNTGLKGYVVNSTDLSNSSSNLSADRIVRSTKLFTAGQKVHLSFTQQIKQDVSIDSYQILGHNAMFKRSVMERVSHTRPADVTDMDIPNIFSTDGGGKWVVLVALMLYVIGYSFSFGPGRQTFLYCTLA